MASRCPPIARIHPCGQEVTRLWLHRDQAGGVAGLADLPRSGPPAEDSACPPDHRRPGRAVPRCAVLVQSSWTVALLASFLELRFGLTLSSCSVRRQLSSSNWRVRRPRMAPSSHVRQRHDPDRPAEEAAIAHDVQDAYAGQQRVLFLDECDLHLLPVLHACWQRGQRWRIPTSGVNAKRAFFGALNATSGAFHVANRPRKLAVHLVAFVDHLAATYPDERQVVAMDNVPTHRAKVVQCRLAAHPRVTVL